MRRVLVDFSFAILTNHLIQIITHADSDCSDPKTHISTSHPCQPPIPNHNTPTRLSVATSTGHGPYQRCRVHGYSFNGYEGPRTRHYVPTEIVLILPPPATDQRRTDDEYNHSMRRTCLTSTSTRSNSPAPSPPSAPVHLRRPIRNPYPGARRCLCHKWPIRRVVKLRL